MGGIVSISSEVVAVEGSSPPTPSSRGRNENNKIVHNEMQIILNGTNECWSGRLHLNTSSDSCWIVFLVVLS